LRSTKPRSIKSRLILVAIERTIEASQKMTVKNSQGELEGMVFV
jgi:hypothetical protein